MIKILPVLILLIFLLCAPAYAFRCGNDIIGRWDSKNKVLNSCGKPSSISYTKVNDNGVIKYGETWLYNCGDNDFIYAVTFIDDKVFKEEPSGRGNGESKCK